MHLLPLVSGYARGTRGLDHRHPDHPRLQGRYHASRFHLLDMLWSDNFYFVEDEGNVVFYQDALLAPPFIPTLVPHSMSGISASARRCLKLEQKSTAHMPTFEYASCEINGESGPAGHRTDVRAEAAIQFREAIRVRVGSSSWKCAVWMNREISVLLRLERVCG